MQRQIGFFCCVVHNDTDLEDHNCGHVQVHGQLFELGEAHFVHPTTHHNSLAIDRTIPRPSGKMSFAMEELVFCCSICGCFFVIVGTFASLDVLVAACAGCCSHSATLLLFGTQVVGHSSLLA